MNRPPSQAVIEAVELSMRERLNLLCAHHAAVVAATIRAVPHLDPDERERLESDLARQCQQCTHDQEDHE